MNIKEYKREYAAMLRMKNRDEYNEYCNNWYHQNIEQQRIYKNEWRKKKVEKLKGKGIINAWAVVNYGKDPIYSKENNNA